jgi:16S rRNA (guanine527-N7)-methyltransferase
VNEQASNSVPPSQPFQSPSSPWRIPEWFSDLSLEESRGLKNFFDQLLLVNRTTSILSPRTLPFVDALHFADAILASRMIYKDCPSANEWFDLGSGNGIPGLVFAILFPQTKVHLVDSDAKKSEALSEIVKALGLKNVDVMNKAIESLAPESVKFSMTRGLSSISKTMLSMRKACPPGGRVYHLKGEEWSMEVAQMPTQLCALWGPALVGGYKLPIGDFKMSVVRTDRLAVR